MNTYVIPVLTGVTGNLSRSFPRCDVSGKSHKMAFYEEHTS
jgi:hypothetical protein